MYHTDLISLIPRTALKRGIQILKERLPASQQSTKVLLEPVYARLPVSHPRGHFANRIKVSNRWYSTFAHEFKNVSRDVVPRVSRGPVRAGIAAHTAHTPFASALRPKLVGGVMSRSAGGYSLGGSARYFSHTPAAPAQVLSQVSAAMRAFTVNGKGQMDHYRRTNGTNDRIGVRAQLASALTQDNAPGAYIDFYLSPTLTCLSPLNSKATSLENSGFLESLGADFGAMLGGLTAVYADIRRLSQLGDLPITLAGPAGDILRVHFRGCDKDFVEGLCDEFGIKRGVVHEDEQFAFSVLAPGQSHPRASWRDMLTDEPPESSTYSEDGFEDEDSEIHPISGSESGGGSDYFFELEPGVVVGTPDAYSSSVGTPEQSFDGLEGIHRFLAECDEYRFGRN